MIQQKQKVIVSMEAEHLRSGSSPINKILCDCVDQEILSIRRGHRSEYILVRC